ncbi:hypothetical protein Plhal304r1_c011g0042741 [Plasmopara halstedii]
MIAHGDANVAIANIGTSTCKDADELGMTSKDRTQNKAAWLRHLFSSDNATFSMNGQKRRSSIEIKLSYIEYPLIFILDI